MAKMRLKISCWFGLALRAKPVIEQLELETIHKVHDA
jgi:hypothetical protein